jgi:hypothetical protein
MSGKGPKAVPPATRLVARLTGARLCFGQPVTSGGRTVITVASVRSVGGGGFGESRKEGTGGGGGGAIEARPVGFIEISAAGTRFERIDDGRTALRAIGAGTLALVVIGRTFRRRRGRGRALAGSAVRRALPGRRGAAASPGPARRRGAAALLLGRGRAQPPSQRS